jgi:hypothetical protein
MKKIISTENGKITISGNGAWIPVEYKQAEWSDGEEAPCFKYKDDHIFLSEVLRTDSSGIFDEYDGILNLSYFHGILIKLSESGDAIQVYYFYY